jgi:hypothetical protein
MDANYKDVYKYSTARVPAVTSAVLRGIYISCYYLEIDVEIEVVIILN